MGFRNRIEAWVAWIQFHFLRLGALWAGLGCLALLSACSNHPAFDVTPNVVGEPTIVNQVVVVNSNFTPVSGATLVWGTNRYVTNAKGMSTATVPTGIPITISQPNFNPYMGNAPLPNPVVLQPIQPASLASRVVDAAGNPLVGASISLNGVTNVAITGTNGAFYLGNLSPGDNVNIGAAMAGYNAQYTEVAIPHPGPAVLPAITLQLGDSLVINVTDINTGAAIGGATVQVTGTHTVQASQFTGAILVDPRPSAQTQFIVTAPGYQNTALIYVPTQGSVANVALAPAVGSLLGSLKNFIGTPLTGARVQLQNTVFATTSDSNGAFQLGTIPAGNYQLAVQVVISGISSSTNYPIQIRAGSPTMFTTPIKVPANLTMQVTGDYPVARAPLAGAFACLKGLHDPNLCVIASADSNGLINFGPVMYDDALVTVRCAGFGDTSTAIAYNDSTLFLSLGATLHANAVQVYATSFGPCNNDKYDPAWEQRFFPTQTSSGDFWLVHNSGTSQFSAASGNLVARTFIPFCQTTILGVCTAWAADLGHYTDQSFTIGPGGIATFSPKACYGGFDLSWQPATAQPFTCP